MKSIIFAKTVVAGAALAVILATFVTTSGRAQGPAGPSEQQEVQIGLNIAPVPLNPIGKDMNLVGLGSFLVNAVGDCNGCHTGSPSGTEYTNPGNPYLLHVPQGPFTGKSQIDPKYYLAGGQDFGPVCPGVGGTVPGCAPDLVTRNLTPNLYGEPEGGHSLSDFLNIIQNGTDYDHIHPICGEKINGVTRTNYCVSAPPVGNINGDVLQVMPWPVFSHMSTYDLTAIWTYLSAIPCINNTWSTGPLADPTELNNTCK
jgi:hypothetical protein